MNHSTVSNGNANDLRLCPLFLPGVGVSLRDNDNKQVNSSRVYVTAKFKQSLGNLTYIEEYLKNMIAFRITFLSYLLI